MHITDITLDFVIIINRISESYLMDYRNILRVVFVWLVRLHLIVPMVFVHIGL